MRSRFPLLIVVLSIVLFSCKKDVVTPQSSFGFKVGTTSYSWTFEPDSPRLEKGALLKRSFAPNSTVPVYVLEGWSYPDALRIECMMNTTSLAVNSYRKEQRLSDRLVESFSHYNHTQFGTVTGDYISVSISEISGKYASGSFYAVMHDLATSTKEIRIFNGTFTRILIEN
jgi:hypothetical protein